MLQFHWSFKNSFTRKISQNPQTPHIQKQPKPSGNAKRSFTPSILRSTHDWFIFTHKSLIDENNRFTLNWDKYEAKARAKTQQLDNFPPRLFTSEAKKMFLYFHVGFRVAFESKETRLECRVECASCATLAGWSNFIWSRLRFDFFKGNFFFTSHVFWTEREEVSESIIKFIYHENRFASLKADLWTRIGREKSPLIWIHFLTETFLCPRISFEWTIVSA